MAFLQFLNLLRSVSLKSFTEQWQALLLTHYSSINMLENKSLFIDGNFDRLCVYPFIFVSFYTSPHFSKFET